MKERPILFTGEMVRAILEGRKTQTRRVVKLPIIDRNGSGCELGASEILQYCPHGQVGDRLWVRETFTTDFLGPLNKIVYRADKPEANCTWKPSIFMGRKHSRITLGIACVRVERVQDISKADAIAEGIDRVKNLPGWKNYEFKTAHPRKGQPATDKEHRIHAYESPRAAFKSLWDSINAKRGFGWEKNPWVWVIEFRKI